MCVSIFFLLILNNDYALYFQFPESSGEPPRILKGFEKVSLLAGERAMVSMNLTPKDFSIFDVNTNDWMPVEGTFTIYAGTSSDDLPLAIQVERSGLVVDIQIL